MIDIHCHLLPGLDDGPKNLEESLAMARLAVRDGIEAVVTTPHTLNGVYNNPKTVILEALNELRDARRKQAIPLKLYPGAEVYFSSDLLGRLKKGEIQTINDGNYLFLELPSQSVPMAAHEVFFDLRVKGYLPIVTHPERNWIIQGNRDILREWIRHGALVQITASSLTGGFGGKVRDCARRLLEEGLVHIMASDAHSVEWRPPVLSEGLQSAAEIIGRDEARKLVNDYPALILAGKPLPEKDLDRPSFKPAKKKFFSRLFS